jgi:Asp/Glu/hydantoin racemase
MRILLINGNTSPDTTDFLAGHARAAASQGVEIIPLTAAFGAPVIAGRVDNAIAAQLSPASFSLAVPKNRVPFLCTQTWR